MEETKKCPKCGGEMKQGLILDTGLLGTAASQQQRWLEGKEEIKGALIVGTNEGYAIKTFRCKNCKFLESYAE